MELADVVRRRRMVRRYADRPVDRAVVDRALDHARRAPSAGFSQGWAFLVLDEPDDVDRFWAATSPEDGSEDGSGDGSAGPSRWLAGMRTAPVVVVPLSSSAAYVRRYAEPDKAAAGLGRDAADWPVPYWHVDAGMAALLVLLTATDEGLGACFFGVPGDRVAALREAFDVPAEYAPVGAITLGHRHPDDDGAAGSPARRARRPLDEVVHRGRWHHDASEPLSASDPQPER